MTEKQKPQQASLTNKISNDFLFLKRFHYRTSLPMPIVIENLKQLNDAQAGDKVKTSKFSVTVRQVGEGYQFQILAGSLKDDKYGIIYGGGQVIPYADSTVVEGSIRFGGMVFGLVIFAFLWNLFFLQFPMPEIWYWFSVGWTVLAMVGGFFGLMRERNLLFEALTQSITPPQTTQDSATRLGDNQTESTQSNHDDSTGQSQYGKQ